MSQKSSTPSATDFPRLIAHEKVVLGKTDGQDLFGLALSGGGIRCSTFCLGVIQHLAQKGLLKKLDYLSTVSGGGYLGSWLAAWIKTAGSITHVERQLVPRPEPNAPSQEAPEIRWLRRYGKYLAPKFALFSADTWAIVALWMRNTVLSLTVLITCLFAAIAFPWFVELGYQTVKTEGPIAFYFGHEFLATTATICAAVGSRRSGETGKGLLGLLAAFLICVSSIVYVFGPAAPFVRWPYVWGGSLTAICVAGMVDWDEERWPRLMIRSALGIGLGAFAMGSAPPLLARLETNWIFFAPIVVPAVVSFSYCLLLTALMGILGRYMTDERREWWSRVGAWMFIFGWIWLLLAGVTLLGPSIVDFLGERYYIGVASGSLWAGLTAIGVYLGRSPSTAGSGQIKHPIQERVLPLIPLVFMTGLLILVSGGLSHLVLERSTPMPLQAAYCPNCPERWVEPSLGASWDNIRIPFVEEVRATRVSPMAAVAFAQFKNLTKIELSQPFYWPLLLFFGFGLLYTFLSRLIDINEFSMHRFYRNRLVRGFQGAARGDKGRHADQFTNLDPKDDIKMVELKKAGYTGPLHLVNTAINMNLTDTGLEERRAASFVFTPYGCGYSVGSDAVGHCQLYPDDCDLRLGTAVTASGAAASPNMGYHTSTVVAFLLTVFNVRLGYWIRNPKLRGRNEWSPMGPRNGQFYFLSELFGLANSARKYVYLSDGGHFENLGVYELLRRRCRFIICIDGEQDVDMKFQGLAGLIRRARADMGVEIRMETADIEERSVEGWSKAHCAVGKIIYPEAPCDTEHSKILYLKLSVTGDEPVDILNYRKENSAFPHQTTGDQFFNESQFESYRRLGFHAAQHAFRSVEVPEKNPDLDTIFKKLFDSWHGLPRGVAGNFTKQADQLDELVKDLATEANLKPLQLQLNPNLAAASADKDSLSAEEFQACFHFCLRLIQLMESVYFDLDLESNFDGPSCAGWMKMFQDWEKSAMFRKTYAASCHIFSKQFVNFFELRIRPKKAE